MLELSRILVLLLMWALALGILEVTALPKPTSKPRYTLDPGTLAEVKELLKVKATSPPSKLFDINVRLGNKERIIFDGQTSSPQVQKQPALNRNATTHKCIAPRDRYHVPSGKCYTAGTAGGPCGDNMLFYAQEDNKLYGECDCDYNAEIPLVYHPPTAACYPIYDQAYCGADQWLVFDDKELPTCEKRKCPIGKDRTMVYLKGRCVFWDEWSSVCKNNWEKVIFLPDTLEPICAEASVSEQSNFNLPKLKCKPGSSQDIKGNCREKIKFNFNG